MGRIGEKGGTQNTEADRPGEWKGGNVRGNGKGGTSGGMKSAEGAEKWNIRENRKNTGAGKWPIKSGETGKEMILVSAGYPAVREERHG